MQLLNYVILSAVEGSPGRVPLVYNQVIAINKLRRKGRFREIHSTSPRFARYDIFADISFTFFSKQTIVYH